MQTKCLSLKTDSKRVFYLLTVTGTVFHKDFSDIECFVFLTLILMCVKMDSYGFAAIFAAL